MYEGADVKAVTDLRSRVSSGMEVEIDAVMGGEFVQRVRGFLDSVDAEAGWVSEVA